LEFPGIRAVLVTSSFDSFHSTGIAFPADGPDKDSGRG
jgi:hypothetical protein